MTLAARQVRSLDSRESSELEHHLASCERCRAAAEPVDDEAWRWLVRVPNHAFGAGPTLPIVDPSTFVVERELASGGMGRVSLAIDRRLGRTVALKEILDPALRERFEREALITAHLQHPAIIPIYEAGTWPDGSSFYTMRLVAGVTLREAIEGARTLAERLQLLHHVVATVEAIAYAHSRRVIHRDLKTTNVLAGELGDTVVIDWGLARQLDGSLESRGAAIPGSGQDLTRVGAVMGTPYFMAPEQARGEATDERADVFALGAILYTLLAGSPPYYDSNGDAAVARVALGPPRSIAELAPEAPTDLLAICERAMAHRPEDRYPTAKELATELRRFEAGQLLARSYSVGELFTRWLRRHRGIVAAAIVALIAIAAISTIAILNVTRSRGGG
ncbi:MAG: serine/threonine-protein kinase, partial [Kofleriaceae bacterium]